MYMSKYINSLFVGSNYEFNLNKNIESIYKEKNEKIKVILEKQKLTDSQFLLRKNYINKLEQIAFSLRTESIFKNILNPVIIYDVNFNILDYNESFFDTFAQNIKKTEILKIHDTYKKTDCIEDYVMFNDKKIKYFKEYIVNINGNKYKVTTSPLFDANKNLECFIRIYTKI